MRRPLLLWPALEGIPGPAAVAAQWQELLGGEYDFLKPYLRPGVKLATSYPRRGNGYHGLPFQVVEHGPGDYVGVCPATGDRITLEKKDLVIYELNLPKLARGLAKALG